MSTHGADSVRLTDEFPAVDGEPDCWEAVKCLHPGTARLALVALWVWPEDTDDE